jgi:pyridoxamine 5'-phosphate oxidase
VDAANLRREYTRAGLDDADMNPDPIVQFDTWFEKVIDANLHEPNAMILATATSEGRPSVRTVLLKGYDGGGFVFYTNYEGRKARELEANPACALLFYWGELERQVRIEGRAGRIPSEESDTYFASRPRGSRLGAWASEQSRPVRDRSVLEERVRALEKEYEGREIPRPLFWGGYRVEPHTIEFWQGRENRLHDRISYRRENDGWRLERLQP